MFGFSRGAFDGAGLGRAASIAATWPKRQAPISTGSFERSWELIQPMLADDSAVESLRAEHRPCPVHFLGVWDTVKSYGGLKPVMLPPSPSQPGRDPRPSRPGHRGTPGLVQANHLGSARRRRRRGDDPDQQSHVRAAGHLRGVVHRLSLPMSGAGEPRRRPPGSPCAGCWPRLPRSTRLSWCRIVAGHCLHPRTHQGRFPSKSRGSSPGGLWSRSPAKRSTTAGVYPRLVGHRGSDGVRKPSDSKRQGTVAVHSTVADHSLVDAPITTVETRRLRPPV